MLGAVPLLLSLARFGIMKKSATQPAIGVRKREPRQLVRLLGIKSGTTVADIGAGRRARIRHELLRKARYSEYGGEEGSNCYSHHVASVQSALRPFCLLQRRERSDALTHQKSLLEACWAVIKVA